MNSGASGAGIVAGMRAIMAASTAALGPVGALTAAIAAWAAALDQGMKLYREWNSSAGHDMWAKFKSDIGYEQGSDVDRSRGIHSGDDYDREMAKRGSRDGTGVSTPLVSMPQPGPMASVAQAQALAASSDPSLGFNMVADAIKQAPVPQVQVVTNVTIGDEQLADAMTRTSIANNVRNGTPANASGL